MPLRTNLGLFLDRVNFTTGDLRSAIGTYKQVHKHGRVPTRTLGTYTRTVAPPAPPWERIWTSSYADIAASIDPYLPRSDIGSIIVGWASVYSNLPSYIVVLEPLSSTLTSLIKGVCSTSTHLHEYQTTIVSFLGGFSVIRNLITKTPDLYAGIHGFAYSELFASVNSTSRLTSDLVALLVVAGVTSEDIYATITPYYTYDIYSSLVSVPPDELPASLTTIQPKYLYGTLTTIPYVPLYAFCGGHLPEDIYASLLVNPPVDLYAFIRRGFSSTKDLSAEVSISSGYKNLTADIYLRYSGLSEIPGVITPRIPKVLTAAISGWAESNLTGALAAIQFKDLQTRIYCWAVEVTSDINSFLRAQRSSTSDLSNYIKGWISTHTSDKTINYTKFPLPPPRIILGTFGAGITIFRPEIIYGDFPDLHAALVAKQKFSATLAAYIVPTIQTNYDLNASIYSNTKQVVHRYLPISFVNAASLYATLGIFSGYNPLGGFVRVVRSENTTTNSGYYWSERMYRIRPIISSTKGLAIFASLGRTYRKLVFINSSPTPDLWAVVYGWEYSSITASINPGMSFDLLSSLSVRTLDKLYDINGYIQSYNVSSLPASLTPYGAFTTISASATAAGRVESITATIYPYFSTSGVFSVGVSTIPFLDIRATINYSESVLGATHSTISNLYGFIDSNIFSNAVLNASISATTDTNNLLASIVGLKSTKIRILNILFRARTRSEYNLNSVIFGVGPGIESLVASITGVVSTYDISASITAKRYLFAAIDRLSPIEVYNIVGEHATLIKEIDIKFGSYVPKYVYDSISKAVYKDSETDKWVLNLTADTTTSDFFDKTASNMVSIESLLSYNSVDEAIRAAIDRLSVGFYSALGATITAVGGYSSLNSSITIFQTYEDVRLEASITGIV